MAHERTDYVSWDTFFMGVAKLAAHRSKDPNTQVGACIVKDTKIIGVGYNGFPRGIPDNDPNFPWTPNEDATESKYSFVVHAELNAILNTVDQSQLKGATLYVTLPPCNECAKAIIQSGITRIVYTGKWREDDYHKAAQKMFERLDTDICRMGDPWKGIL